MDTAISILSYLPLTRLCQLQPILSKLTLAKLLSYKYNINNDVYYKIVDKLGYLNTYLNLATINGDLCQQSLLYIPANFCLFLAILTNNFDLTQYFLNHCNINISSQNMIIVFINQATNSSKQIAALVFAYLSPLIYGCINLVNNKFINYFGNNNKVYHCQPIVPVDIINTDHINGFVSNLGIINSDIINQAKIVLTKLESKIDKTKLDRNYIAILSILLNQKVIADDLHLASFVLAKSVLNYKALTLVVNNKISVDMSSSYPNSIYSTVLYDSDKLVDINKLHIHIDPILKLSLLTQGKLFNLNSLSEIDRLTQSSSKDVVIVVNDSISYTTLIKLGHRAEITPMSLATCIEMEQLGLEVDNDSKTRYTIIQDKINKTYKDLVQ